MPCSIAFFAHSSAASCAANGVDLREPLKPAAPALDQASAPPDGSVIVTIVLLNVDWMWATPDWTFFLTFFLPPSCHRFPDHLLLRPAPSSCRRPSSRGPLRVRALVCVR